MSHSTFISIRVHDGKGATCTTPTDSSSHAHISKPSHLTTKGRTPSQSEEARTRRHCSIPIITAFKPYLGMHTKHHAAVTLPPSCPSNESMKTERTALCSPAKPTHHSRQRTEQETRSLLPPLPEDVIDKTRQADTENNSTLCTPAPSKYPPLLCFAEPSHPPDTHTSPNKDTVHK